MVFFEHRDAQGTLRFLLDPSSLQVCTDRQYREIGRALRRPLLHDRYCSQLVGMLEQHHP